MEAPRTRCKGVHPGDPYGGGDVTNVYEASAQDLIPLIVCSIEGKEDR